MKKSQIATLVVFLLMIPLTLFLGTKLTGRGYYITGTLIILELMAPFLMAFEGRKPQARELVIIAVLCALAIAGRVVIPLPHCKAVFAVIMLAGIAFGPEAGFMVGAVTAFASNFFYGQGPFTTWQMFAYGAGGMLAGFCFRRGLLPRKRWIMSLFGFLTTFLWIGPLLDLSSVFFALSRFSWAAMVSIFVAGIYVNLSQSVCTAAVMFLLGGALLEKLERIQLKYGMLENNPAL